MSLRTDPTPLSRPITDPDGVKRCDGYAGCHSWTDASGAMKHGPYVQWNPETDVVRLLGSQPGAGELRLWESGGSRAAAIPADLMTTPFQPGSKVVCIDDSPHALTPQLGRLTKGTIYCVEYCRQGGRYCWVRLIGDPYVINPVTVKYPPPEPHVWGAHRFRAIWTQTISVELALSEACS